MVLGWVHFPTWPDIATMLNLLCVFTNPVPLISPKTIPVPAVVGGD